MAGSTGDGERHYSSVPIPSYDEAISSAGRSQDEEQDTLESQGLLGHQRYAYQAPSVESARTSLASDEDAEDELQLPEMNRDDERRQIEELDFLDAPDTSRRSPRLYHRSRSRRRMKWSQHFSNLGTTLSSIRIPTFRLYRSVATDPTPTQTLDTRSFLSRVIAHLTIPERYRMSGPNFARLCGLFTLVFIIYAIFAFDILPRNRHRMGALINPEELRSYIQQNVNPDNMRKLLSHMTSFDHVAGTAGDLYMAKWLEERWQEDGGFDEVQMIPYYVYLNYPGDRSVSITSPQSKAWSAVLEEDSVYPDRQQSKSWHTHSKSGRAEGHLVYANEGSRGDFAYLQSHNILTNGSIALIRYGGPETRQSTIVRNAAEAGCAGVLLYSDPRDFDKLSDWQPPDDMVQRSSVSMHSLVIGDPLTPGWASTLDSNRLSKEDNLGLPSIPSLPLSWREAKVLIEALQGHGERVPADWVGGPPENAYQEWYTGCAPSEADGGVPIVDIKNLNDDSPLQQIWNIHGLIEGLEDPQSKIIVGSPRDAFCFGAIESGSGSAVMTELVRLFGGLRAFGWRPLRSIEFVSWDAREFNFAGSTEYVEDHLAYLQDHAVAYINVDKGVSGANLHASGSPLLQRALMHVLGHVNDPEHEGQSMKMWWESVSAALADPDTTHDGIAFQHIVGTTSMDLGFIGHPYPQHSCYDTLEWMEAHGDPIDFKRHSTLAQIWALLILELADRPLLPFDVRSYAQRLDQWVSELERDMSQASDTASFILQPLKDTITNLSKEAETFHTFEDTWTTGVLASGGQESQQFFRHRWEYNNRLAHFDTWMLDLKASEGCPLGGLEGRCQYKHTVFGPPRGDGDKSRSFPFIRDAVEDGDWPRAQRWVDRVTASLEEATKRLME